jgi:hypothetical protein
MPGEIIQTATVVTEYAPATGLVAGAAIGVLIDHLNHKKLAAERQSAAEVFEDANISARPERSGFARIANKVGAYTVALGLIGVANGFAWQQSHRPAVDTGSIPMGVDRSGASLFGDGPKTPAQRTEELSEAFASDKSLKVFAVIGQQGSVSGPKDASQVKDIEPQGGVRMTDLFDTVVDKAEFANDTKTSTPVVIITHGNSFGNVSTASRKANRAGAKVFVVDTRKNTPSANTRKFEGIAERTGGHYWKASEISNEEIVRTVASEMNPANTEPGEGKGWPWKVFAGVVSLVGLAGASRIARNVPITFNGTDFS